MKSKSNYFIPAILSLLLVVILDSEALNVSRSCEEKCGDIYIPYPFGVREGCYLNDWYRVECRNASFPFLSKINMEIVGISIPRLSFGVLRVKMAITSMGCSSSGKESGSLLNVTGSPFFFGEENKLIAVGCNNKASLTNSEPTMVGCESTCSTFNVSRSIPFFDKIGCTGSFLPGDYKSCEYQEDTFCGGNGCCEVSIPNSAQQIIGIRIESTDGNSFTRGDCQVAFFTDEESSYYLSNSTKPEQLFAMGYATVSLKWFIQTSNLSFILSLGCLNKVGSIAGIGSCLCASRTISGISYANCECNDGYSGNPYLSNGCEDVNECLKINHGITEYCVEEGYTCVNLVGSYTCVDKNEKWKKSRAIIRGVGAGFGVLVSAGGIWLLIKVLMKQKMKRRKRKFFKRNGGMLLEQQLSSTEGKVEKTRIFSSKELEKATENFSKNRILGEGGQGTVYKGMLIDGRTVAVKKSKAVDEDNLEEFINEVVILSQINHRHVVKLLGCCLETEVPVLVYEFIPNGNLFQHLHEESDDYTIIWGVRLRIAVDIAGSLSYLHSAACSPIYHRDIKSTNILLDEKYRAKVSDFGTSRSVTIDHTHWTTKIISGTIGYLDPEYLQSNQYTEKSDVYGFGVVLAELITGEKPVLYTQTTQPNMSLVEYFRVAMKEKRFFSIMDARIKDYCRVEQVMAVANLAKKCLNSKGKNRPNMREVFTELERISSSLEDSQMHIGIDDDEEEEAMEVMPIADFVNNAVTAPASIILAPSFSLDIGSLVHRPSLQLIHRSSKSNGE